jgi:hypothetical protein
MPAPGAVAELVERFARCREACRSGGSDEAQRCEEFFNPFFAALGWDVYDRKSYAKVLQGIIRGLDCPDSPCESSVLPIETLGQVYERFLGRVIPPTRDGRPVVGPEGRVKKAGGVYYTPTYVVDYIVEQTVGTLLRGESGERKVEGRNKGKANASLPLPPGEDRGEGAIPSEGLTSKRAAKLRILDPACGAGSFLIGAYQHLLDWYRDWYVRDDAEKHARGRNPRLDRTRAGDWRLTTAERKRILLNNVYGVDVDPQAVEVAKLSLLLKLLEDGAQEALGNERRPLHQPALPDLAANVKCGNSLVGPDLRKHRQMTPREKKVVGGNNAFDWEAEFPRVLQGKNAGFDAVIGNPPYRRELGYKNLLDEIAATPFGKRYRSPRMDLWYYFVHRGLELLKPGGQLAFIVNAHWASGTGADKLIAALRDTAHVEEIFLLGKLRVFEGVSGRHMIIQVTNAASERATTVRLAQPDSETRARPFVTGQGRVLAFEKTAEQLFQGDKVDLEPPADAILSKLERWPPLGELGIVRQGIAENPASVNKRTNDKYGGRWTVGEGVFALAPEELERFDLPDEERQLLRPYYAVCDIGRYFLAPEPSLALIYSTRHTCPDVDRFPHVRRHLGRFREIMQQRRETRKGSNSWWHLHWPRDERLWESAKILSVQMGPRPAFVPALKRAYGPFSVNVFVPDNTTQEHLSYLCALLNSRTLWKWYQHRAKRRGVGLEINGHVLARTPIRRIDFADNKDENLHDRVVELVSRLLSVRARLEMANTARQKAVLQRQLDATDARIDRLVYELYGLTGKEVAILEEATAS